MPLPIASASRRVRLVDNADLSMPHSLEPDTHGIRSGGRRLLNMYSQNILVVFDTAVQYFCFVTRTTSMLDHSDGTSGQVLVIGITFRVWTHGAERF